MPHSDIGYLLNRATRHVRLRLAEAIAETGLTPQQAAVLLALSHSPECRLTPLAVAHAVGSDAASTSGLLDRMGRAGWVSSEPNPADGRSRYVVLTEQARAVLPQVIDSAAATSARATRDLTESERDTLAGLLQRIGRDSSSDATVGEDV